MEYFELLFYCALAVISKWLLARTTGKKMRQNTVVHTKTFTFGSSWKVRARSSLRFQYHMVFLFIYLFFLMVRGWKRFKILGAGTHGLIELFFEMYTIMGIIEIFFTTLLVLEIVLFWKVTWFQRNVSTAIEI